MTYKSQLQEELEKKKQAPHVGSGWDWKPTAYRSAEVWRKKGVLLHICSNEIRNAQAHMAQVGK